MNGYQGPDRLQAEERWRAQERKEGPSWDSLFLVLVALPAAVHLVRVLLALL